MRLSKLFTKTQRQAPRDETSRSAQLLLRAGFIHKELAGVYTFLPLGLKVLKNIEQIVREEMDAIGGQELQMTALQSKEIWEKTGRWDDKAVDVWFKTKLKSGGEVGLALSHEEPMTRIVANYANSYKDLPVYAYQFQWKLRNELRAKSGILRGREFRMKDLYSYSTDQDQHDKFYEQISLAYHKVFDRLGIGEDTYYTYAGGGIFSQFSHEFQTLLEVGEDTIYIDEEKKIAFNEADDVMTDQNLKDLGVDRDNLRKAQASEVGNIFPLGTKYAKALGAVFTDEKGEQHPMVMGSYGIGISRLVAVLAEYFADDAGLVWPESVAPYQIHLVRLGEDKAVVAAANKLYDQLTKAGKTVLYDDRDLAAGAKFADADLIGIPTRYTISPKTLEKDSVEVKQRTADKVDSKSLSQLD